MHNLALANDKKNDVIRQIDGGVKVIIPTLKGLHMLLRIIMLLSVIDYKYI